jgi:hypothetical protein
LNMRACTKVLSSLLCPRACEYFKNCIFLVVFGNALLWVRDHALYSFVFCVNIKPLHDPKLAVCHCTRWRRQRDVPVLCKIICTIGYVPCMLTSLHTRLCCMVCTDRVRKSHTTTQQGNKPPTQQKQMCCERW